MPSDKRTQLAKLGADTLAMALLDLATCNEDAESVVDRLLASPKENAKTFMARLSSLKRRRHFITWGESGAYAHELASILEDLKASVTKPCAGVEAVAAFYQADTYIFDKTDDSNGSIGNVFKFNAADLFVLYASACEEKEWLVDLVIKLNQKNGYGVRDVLFEKMSKYLPEHLMRAAVEKLWKLAESEGDKYASRHWLFAIADLAEQLKDPALLEAAKRAASDGELSTAAIIEIAKLHFQCADSAVALTWIERVPTDMSFMEHERDELLIEIYKSLNDTENLAETAWRVFRRYRSADTLETLLAVIGKDKRESVITKEAKSILKTKEFDCADAAFLIEAGRVDDADQYILMRADKLNGDFYSNLLPLAKCIMKHDRLVAASVIYRALLDSILARAKSKNYHHAVNYLKKLDSLAPKIRNWQDVQSHAGYMIDLRLKHKLKNKLFVAVLVARLKRACFLSERLQAKNLGVSRGVLTTSSIRALNVSRHQRPAWLAQPSSDRLPALVKRCKANANKCF